MLKSGVLFTKPLHTHSRHNLYPNVLHIQTNCVHISAWFHLSYSVGLFFFCPIGMHGLGNITIVVLDRFHQGVVGLLLIFSGFQLLLINVVILCLLVTRSF